MFMLTLSDYEITRDGKVINKRNGHVVIPQRNGKGYLRVSIGGKMRFVHRLVADKYIPNPENKPQVNHIDGNKLNNCVENLEWVSNQENRSHAMKNNLHLCGEKSPKSKLKAKDVLFIRENYDNFTKKDLAEMFNVSKATIQDIKRRKSWKQL